jgi:hypothetical protein
MPVPTDPGNFNPGNFNPGNPNPGNFNPGNPNPGNFNPGNPNPGGANPVNPLPFATPNFPSTQTAPRTGTPNTPGFPGNLLTTPRPEVNPAAAQNTQQPMGQQIGGGIAGIASKAEDPAIMVYNDRTNYNEWEFIFDYSKQQGLPGLNGATIGTPAANLGTPASNLGTPAGVGQPGLTPAGLGASSTASPFGTPGLGPGQASPFGMPASGLGPGQASPFGGINPSANLNAGASPGTNLPSGVPGQAGGAQQGNQPKPNNLRLGRP